MNELTVEQAIEQGYEHCGDSNDSWTILSAIKDLKEIDFEDKEYWVFGKEKHYPVIGEGEMERLGEMIDESWCDETGQDDDSGIIKVFKGFDLHPLINEINSKLKEEVWCKYATDIKLIWKN